MEANINIEQLVREHLEMKVELQLLKGLLYSFLERNEHLDSPWDSEKFEKLIAKHRQSLFLAEIAKLDWNPDWLDSLDSDLG